MALSSHLIVGLGNPGGAYAHTRHNVGFWFLDLFQQASRFPDFKVKGNTQLSRGEMAGYSVILCKPMTFMNLSGQGVAPLAKFCKLPLGNILVIHDELDLPLGCVRFKRGGGHGGHNGLRSLHQHLGEGYLRLRIGIGRPEPDRESVSDYVLGKWTPLQAEHMTRLLKTLIPLVEELWGSHPEKAIEAISLMRAEVAP